MATCGNLIAAMCTPPPLEAIDQDHRPVLVTNGDLERPQLDVLLHRLVAKSPARQSLYLYKKISHAEERSASPELKD
jgi:hypothetical protein